MLIGIVGKANVGKSTFFNSATELTAQAANYPFTTRLPPNRMASGVRERPRLGPGPEEVEGGRRNDDDEARFGAAFGGRVGHDAVGGHRVGAQERQPQGLLQGRHH